jgi:type IV secretion system protein VirB10
LVWGAVVLLVSIGLVLIMRAVTGTTLKEQKAEASTKREAEQLASRPPGDAVSLSAKLDARRREAEETAAKALPPVNTGGSGFPNTSVPSSTVTGTAGGLTPPAANFPNPNGIGQRAPIGQPSEAEIDAYAATKDQAMREANRKIASWEQSNGQQGMLAGGGTSGQTGGVDLTQLAAAQAAASNASAAGNSGGGSGLQQVIAAALSSQQAPQSSSAEQFRKGVDKSIAPPLVAQTGPGRFSLLQGSTIPVVMRVAVSSDIAGPCRAQVTHDVFDTVTQTQRLIPAGSTVVCSYNAEVVQGQERLLLVFTRLIFPNGSSVALGGMDVADPQGAIGAPAEVNTRFWRTFGSAMLIAAVTRFAERSSNSSGGVTINTGSASGNTAASVLADVAKRSLDRNMQVKPELRLSPGDLLRVVVTRDMLLDPAVTGL